MDSTAPALKRLRQQIHHALRPGADYVWDAKRPVCRVASGMMRLATRSTRANCRVRRHQVIAAFDRLTGRHASTFRIIEQLHHRRSQVCGREEIHQHTVVTIANDLADGCRIRAHHAQPQAIASSRLQLITKG